MAFSKTKVYNGLMKALKNTNTSEGTISGLEGYKDDIYKLDLEDKYSEPMVVIGVYIAVASLWCVLLMGADFLHGLRSRKLWFPCKYFSINAFSLAVIAVAMKLPVDLSGNMPGDVDQAAKLGSMAFMCVMMANLLPCLATMSSTELLTNITATGVLVITLVVNVCIQIHTGVVGTIPNDESLEILSVTGSSPKDLKVVGDILYSLVAGIYVALLLLLLIIYVCSSLGILRSKEIIETKYQKEHKAASKAAGKLLTVEELHQHVSSYWIMAGSGSPQFITACSATATASGVICVFTLIFHSLTMVWVIDDISKGDKGDYNSDYKKSTLAILIVQFVGVILGTFAPGFRCFASLNFKVSIKIISNHIKVFKVEKYWTQKLYDWKDGSISLPFRSHTLKVVINNLKRLILSICIVLQALAVVICKIIALILFLLTMCLRCLRWLLQFVSRSSGKGSENSKQRKFVLQLENENELAETTLKDLSKSLNRLIKKREKKQPVNLMKLITERSTKDFQGVRTYDNSDHPDCWSLAVVTLTTIAATLNIEQAEVKSLLKSVREGLEYVTLVEENLNATDDYKSIKKAAKTLWGEVDLGHKLRIRLNDIASQGNIQFFLQKAPQIVQLFLEKAKSNIEGQDGNSECIPSICANSMSRIAQTIIDDKESHEKLFDELTSGIADIMAACLTNLPRAIAMKCHTSVIEKREASVQAAAQFLGETKKMIKTLHEGALKDKWHAYSSMKPEDLPFIDNWRAHLSEP